MKTLLHPIPIGAVLVAVLGAVLSNPAMVVLGLLVAVASVGLLAARGAQATRAADLGEGLSNEGRTRLQPVRRLVGEIDRIVQENAQSATVQIMGAEARAESQRLYDQVAKSLAQRDGLERSLHPRYEAQKALEAARARRESATGAEADSLDQAIAARTQELAQYDKAQAALQQIDVGVAQAEAALAEMKAKLAVSATGDQIATSNESDLRDSLSRMKSLSAGYDEADQVIRGS